MEEYRRKRDLTVAIEHGFIDPVELAHRIVRAEEELLADCPDVREMIAEPVVFNIDVKPRP